MVRLMKRSNVPDGCCGSWLCESCPGSGLSRRNFLARAGSVSASSLALPPARAQSRAKEPNRQQPIQTPLKVQPVFTYLLYKRRQATSWRSWGGIMTEEQAAAEQERIRRELAAMSATAGFPLQILPLVTVLNPEQAAVAKGDHDVLLLYPPGMVRVQLLEALTLPGRWNLMFLRHRSGPVYNWYENVHCGFLRRGTDAFKQTGINARDIVVDRVDELLWRLRALYALKNTSGKRVVAIGGAWQRVGGGPNDGLAAAREQWKLDLRTVPYPGLGERIKKARQDDALVKRCAREADRYLKQKGTTLETSRDFVQKAFVLTEVLRDLLDEAQTDCLTVNSCMGAIMPVSETTACLPLSILNDEGYTAFCQGDFVVIPSGVLLHYLSGKPVFLNDPTFPHDGVMTLAHCTAPRRMDGERNEPARIMTHFESDYGAAPKVEMRKGQRITNLVPDFASRRWLGVEADILASPFMPICRSQIDVQIRGDIDRLNEETKGWHWMTCYGSHLRETGYALSKLGIGWLTIS